MHTADCDASGSFETTWKVGVPLYLISIFCTSELSLQILGRNCYIPPPPGVGGMWGGGRSGHLSCDWGEVLRDDAALDADVLSCPVCFCRSSEKRI